MLFVKIYGVPDSTSQEKLSEVKGALELTIPFVKNIELSCSQVSVLFPEDKLKERPEIKIIAEVSGLSEKQSKSAGRGLAETIRNILFAKFENASQVACSVKPSNEKFGFALISR
ncbi:hypothetical protein KAT63_01120 [Candidatus Parcubacteria bacterium]|nr:hypothetical protein [Candidatus Parcubacteria bacterium]